jgi:ABC-type Fe3+ transport system permease subunit
LFTGTSHYSGRQLSFYGEAVSVALMAYLVVLSAGLWWLMVRIVRNLATEESAAPAGEPPQPLVSPRAVAVWAMATALVIVPIGAALAPAWQGIRDVLLGSL